MADKIPKIPILNELEEGGWPGFVKEIKMPAKKSPWLLTFLGN